MTRTNKTQIKKECSECHRPLVLSNYYNTNNILSGDGKSQICKDCIKKKIDINNIQTVYDVLKSLDVPFLYNSWKGSLNKKPNNPFGDYIRQANSGINEFKNKTWDDSCFLPELIDGNKQEISKKNNKQNTKNKENSLNIDSQIDSYLNDFIITDEIIDKWGFGYSDEEYYCFEKKWKKLIDNYGEKTSLHVEGLVTYIRYRVKEELATAKDNIKEAKDWGALASQAGKDAKLNVSQLSKSDISGGVELVPQLLEAVESEVGIIPILPYLKEQPYDDADIIIWCIVNYIRRLEDKPMAEYKDIWNFYDTMLGDYFTSQGYSDEKIEEEKKKRNAVFKDLGQFYKEPVYENGDV